MTLSLMDHKENVLFILKNYVRDGSVDIPPILNEYIERVAMTGETMFQWTSIKPLILNKFEKIVNEFCEDYPVDNLPQNVNTDGVSFSELKKLVFTKLEQFTGIPFTIQRLCELLAYPRQHYNRPDKFLRGFERACMVVSTVDPHGNKIVSDDPRFAPLGTSSTSLNGSSEVSGADSWGLGDSSPPASYHSPSGGSPAVICPMPPGLVSSPTATAAAIAASSPKLAVESLDSTKANYGVQSIETLANRHGGLLPAYADDECEEESEVVPGPGPGSSLLPGAETSKVPPSGDSSNTDKHNQQSTSPIAPPTYTDKLPSSSSNTNLGPATTTATSSIAVPSIGEILRPIGQLEAFVQNVSCGTGLGSGTGGGGGAGSGVCHGSMTDYVHRLTSHIAESGLIGGVSQSEEEEEMEEEKQQASSATAVATPPCTSSSPPSKRRRIDEECRQLGHEADEQMSEMFPTMSASSDSSPNLDLPSAPVEDEAREMSAVDPVTSSGATIGESQSESSEQREVDQAEGVVEPDLSVSSSSDTDVRLPAAVTEPARAEDGQGQEQEQLSSSAGTPGDDSTAVAVVSGPAVQQQQGGGIDLETGEHQ